LCVSLPLQNGSLGRWSQQIVAAAGYLTWFPENSVFCIRNVFTFRETTETTASGELKRFTTGADSAASLLQIPSAFSVAADVTPVWWRCYWCRPGGFQVLEMSTDDERSIIRRTAACRVRHHEHCLVANVLRRRIARSGGGSFVSFYLFIISSHMWATRDLQNPLGNGRMHSLQFNSHVWM
jgi:hypothetical protein